MACVSLIRAGVLLRGERHPMGRVLQLLIVLVFGFSASARADMTCPVGKVVELTVSSFGVLSYSSHAVPDSWNCAVGLTARGSQSMTSAEIGALAVSSFSSCFVSSGSFNYSTSSYSYVVDWRSTGSPGWNSANYVYQSYEKRDYITGHTPSSYSALGAARVNLAVACITPPQNPCNVGDTYGPTFWRNSSPSSLCVSGCSVTKSHSGILLTEGDEQGMETYGVATGEQCTTSTPQSTQATTGTLPDSTLGACVQAGTNKSCISEDKAQCGYVNGEYRCYTSSQLTDTNPCVQTTSGAVFCKSDAPTQPLAPTDSSGNKLPADTTFKLCKTPTDCTTVNWYSNGTVNNGAENPGNDNGSTTGGTTGGSTGGSTGGDCTGDGCSDSVSGGTDCTAPPTCDGSPIECYIAQQTWYTRCNTSKPDQDKVDSTLQAALASDGQTLKQGELIPEDQSDPDGDGEPGYNVGRAVQLALQGVGHTASGACVPDLVIPIAFGNFSKQVIVPLHLVCGIFDVIAWLVLASSAIKAGHIYLRGATSQPQEGA